MRGEGFRRLLPVVLRRIRAAIAVGALGLAGSSCSSAVTTISFAHGPIVELDVDRDDDGRWLGVMPGAFGLDVQGFPNGDLLLVGSADTPFVQRLSADGETKWSLPIVACGSMRAAVGDDDATYVAVHGLLAFGDAADRATKDRRRVCGASTPAAPTTIFRLDRRGRVVWKTLVLPGGPALPVLLASRERLLVMGYEGGTEPISTSLSLSPAGRLEWSKRQRGTAFVAAWSSTGSALVGIQWGTSGDPCTLRALDPRSGNVEWERPIGLDVVGNYHSCLPRVLAAGGKRSIVWTSGATQNLHGLDLDGRCTLWTKDIEALDAELARAMPARPTEKSARDHALLIRYLPTPELGRVYDATVVAVDPRFGHAWAIATFEEEVPGWMSDGVSIHAASWGRKALLVTGSFYASMRLDGIEVSTSPEYGTSCRSIDPGFGPGSSSGEKRRVERGPWRGFPRVICPGDTYAQPTRTFRSALFVASIPLSKPR